LLPADAVEEQVLTLSLLSFCDWSLGGARRGDLDRALLTAAVPGRCAGTRMSVLSALASQFNNTSHRGCREKLEKKFF